MPAAKKAAAKKTTASPRKREQVLSETQAKTVKRTTAASNKTVPTKQSVAAFIDAVPDERRRADAKRFDAIIREVTGEKPVMWGGSIIGYGQVKMTYATGRVVEWGRVGFSPRKASTSLYLLLDLDEARPLLDKLGPHTTGKGCIYIKRLDDLDEKVLRRLVKKGWDAAPRWNVSDDLAAAQRPAAKQAAAKQSPATSAATAKATPAKKSTASPKTASATSAAPADIDGYLATLDEPKRSTLQELRARIHAVVPDAVEAISYGMPAFKLDGKTVAGFAAFKDHLAYLPFSGSTLGALAADLTSYTYTKSSLHFPIDKPLPKTLVRKLIAERRREAGV